MKILIVNAFAESFEGKGQFDEFVQIIKNVTLTR